MIERHIQGWAERGSGRVGGWHSSSSKQQLLRVEFHGVPSLGVTGRRFDLHDRPAELSASIGAAPPPFRHRFRPFRPFRPFRVSLTRAGRV